MTQPAWVTPEDATKRRLRPELRPYLRLARACHAFAEAAITARVSGGASLPTRLQARLLIQASHQLRVLSLAAERGYPLQAVGAAATLYEHVSAAAYLDGNEDAAAKWQAHTNPERTFPPADKRATGMRFMLTKTGVPPQIVESLVAAWEQHYQAFCVAKHGNPILLRKYGVSTKESPLTLHVGPITGAQYNHLSRIALFHGSRLLADGSVLLGWPFLQSGAPARFVSLKRRRRAILAQIESLAATISKAAPLRVRSN